MYMDLAKEFKIAEEYDPDEDYPPIGTEETALIISIDCDNYHVIAHTGRYFYGQINCAGFSGEEIGITCVPDDAGVWYFYNGKVHTSTDWETGVVDDVVIDGDIRKAKPSDFEKFGEECPLDLDGFCRVN